jgi:hypothetical protein
MSPQNQPVIVTPRGAFLATRPCVVHMQYLNKVLDGDPRCWGPVEGVSMDNKPGRSLPMCQGHREQLAAIGRRAFAKRYFRDGMDEALAAAEGYEQGFLKAMGSAGLA